MRANSVEMTQCKADFKTKGEAEGNMDLNINIGHLLTNAEKQDNVWYTGKTMSTGKVDFFPRSHITDRTNSKPVEALTSGEHLPARLVTTFPARNGIHEGVEGETSNIIMKESTEDIKKTPPPRPLLPAQVRWKNISREKNDNEENNSGDNKKENKIYKRTELLHKFSPSKEILTQTATKLFLTDKDQNKKLKAIFGAITGVLLGGMIFLVLRYSFGYSELEAGITVAVVTVLVSLGLALSMFFRCVVALVIPNFFTGKGRAVILSIIFGFMLSHSVQNIKSNMKEVAESTSCIADLALDQARDLQRQMKKPLTQAAEYIVRQKNELKQLQDEMRTVTVPLKSGLKEMNEEIRNIQTTLDSIKKNCFEGSYAACLAGCDEILDTILNEIKEICKEACRNLKEATQVSCNFLTLVDDKLRQTISKNDEGLKILIDYFIVNLTTTMKVNAEANSSKSIESIKSEVKEELDSKMGAFIHFIKIMEKVLSLTLILLFLQSFWYVRNYLARDSYDNIYITKRFKDLDHERKELGLDCVLPLKKKEKKLYIDTRSWRITLVKIGNVEFGIAQIALHFLMCLSVLCFDYLLYYILDLLKRHGNVNIQYKGDSKFQLSIDGTGFVANFYRNLIQAFNINESYIGELNITDCLPDPSKPDSSSIAVYIILYLVAVLFVLLKECALRTRRKIAAYFYPKQEEVRIYYLHKLIRHKRISFWKFMRQKIKSFYKENCVSEQLQLMTWLSLRIPCLARCLSQKDKTCLSCETTEGGLHDIDLVKCSGDQCNAYYCTDCFETLNKKCPLCSVDDVTYRE